MLKTILDDFFNTSCGRGEDVAPRTAVMTAEEQARMMAELGRNVIQRLNARGALPEPQNVEDKEERRSARDRSRTGKSCRPAHRQKADGAP
jgi:hypothetical protein